MQLSQQKYIKSLNHDEETLYEAHKGEEDFIKPFHIYTATDELVHSKGNAVAQFFIWAFLGFIFFIGAASVLYFRMYNDLTNEKQNILRLQSLD